MNKKDLVAILISATVSWGVAHAQTNESNKLNFTLSPKTKLSYLDINARPELKSYTKLQECLRRMGEDYDMMIILIDNKPVFVPAMTYPVFTARPEPDYKFMIKPKPEFNLPKEFKLKNDYGKKSQGILLFEQH